MTLQRLTPSEHAAMERLAAALADLSDEDFMLVADRLTRGRFETLLRAEIAQQVQERRESAERAAKAHQHKNGTTLAMIAHTERAQALQEAEHVVSGADETATR